MPEENPLTREAFDYLAQAAGLDLADPHLDDLFPYVRNALAGMERLRQIAGADTEPDQAFRPAQPFQE